MKIDTFALVKPGPKHHLNNVKLTVKHSGSNIVLCGDISSTRGTERRGAYEYM